MSVRNENIGLAVFLLILLVGYSGSGWEPSDSAVQLIVAVAFIVGFLVSTLLNDRDDRRSRSRGRSSAEG